MRKDSRIKNQQGSTMVEFSMSVVAFAFLIIASSQIALAGYRAVALNYVASSTMRWAILGKTLPGLNRVQSIEKTARDAARTYGITLSATNIHVCPASNPSCPPGTESAGQPRSSIVISLTAPTNLIFGGFTVTPSARVVGTNEP